MGTCALIVGCLTESVISYFRYLMIFRIFPSIIFSFLVIYTREFIYTRYVRHDLEERIILKCGITRTRPRIQCAITA